MKKMKTLAFQRTLTTTPMLVACMLALTLAAACSRPPRDRAPGTTAPAGLENIRWNLVRLGDAAKTLDVPAGEVYVMLDSNEMSATGNAGCNGFGGSYELDGNHLKFRQLISTRMACEGRMQLESAFLAALDATDRWSLAGTQLELYDRNGKLLANFTPQ
jgi:copper homeostasis protein (lipoprotein)